LRLRFDPAAPSLAPLHPVVAGKRQRAPVDPGEFLLRITISDFVSSGPRSGIHCYSGGGHATADAMFRYPNPFKPGISESGNHFNRQHEPDCNLKSQRLPER
jgi:hypothetical protein